MNCVSEITNYVRAMKQSAFYPFCPHPHFILFVRIRILSFFPASAFYPFCPHPNFIPFVRIRILSFLSASAFYPFLSASAFYPFCPHPHFILFVRIRILSFLSVRPSACPSACPSVRIRVLSHPLSETPYVICNSLRIYVNKTQISISTHNCLQQVCNVKLERNYKNMYTQKISGLFVREVQNGLKDYAGHP